MTNRIVPLKKFGQNYLRDKNIINKIIETFNPEPDNSVVEIGPGTGALTKLLFDKVKKFTAVEIDKRVIEQLKNEMTGLNIINEDFLEIDLSKFTGSKNKIRIIGNIPYNLTSPIIFKLFENREYIQDAMLMVQYEVAQRMTAARQTKDYGIFSVLLNYFASAKLCFKISPNVFFPKPKVWSAIVHINFEKEVNNSIEDELFIKVVKASFGNRRKTLKNSLSNSIFRNLNFDTMPFNLSRRAEELTIQEFIELTQIIKGRLNG
ncbi:MAG: ribosomal RNA small subunit methyltransferase A [Ignavibacteriales bacterium]|nr:ribosomal RNA small subunit methyltransferase A [Ignavibacteriales bacterium]